MVSRRKKNFRPTGRARALDRFERIGPCIGRIKKIARQ